MSARAWASFLSVSILWGIPYFFIKVAVDDGMPPAFLAWARVTLGALILAAMCWRLGLLGSLRGRWRMVSIYAVLEIAIPFPLIAAGEQRVSSSLAAILIASAVSDSLGDVRAWTLVAAVAIGYMLSRGLAKSGTKYAGGEDPLNPNSR